MLEQNTGKGGSKKPEYFKIFGEKPFNRCKKGVSRIY
jgi:hypothetical protein